MVPRRSLAFPAHTLFLCALLVARGSHSAGGMLFYYHVKAPPGYDASAIPLREVLPAAAVGGAGNVDTRAAGPGGELRVPLARLLCATGQATMWPFALARGGAGADLSPLRCYCVPFSSISGVVVRADILGTQPAGAALNLASLFPPPPPSPPVPPLRGT